MIRDTRTLGEHDIDFYTVFRVLADGECELLREEYAPEVYLDYTYPDSDVSHDKGWEPLTGYTGQYGYNGAVMHASEFFGGGLLRDVAADIGGVYVMVPVYDPEPDEDEDDIAGWCILRQISKEDD